MATLAALRIMPTAEICQESINTSRIQSHSRTLVRIFVESTVTMPCKMEEPVFVQMSLVSMDQLLKVNANVVVEMETNFAEDITEIVCTRI